MVSPPCDITQPLLLYMSDQNPYIEENQNPTKKPGVEQYTNHPEDGTYFTIAQSQHLATRIVLYDILKA